MNFMLIATAWGSKFGGVNAFNMDFAKGLASFLGKNGRVFCGVLHATDTEVLAAANNPHVTLLPLHKGAVESKFDSSSAYEFYSNFQERFPGQTIDYWVGHDVITGNVAILGAELSKTQSALIMHMNYEAYQSYKTGVGKVSIGFEN